MTEFANSLGTGGGGSGGGLVDSHRDGFESAQLNELSLRNWSIWSLLVIRCG